jgi:hypothetical protein
MGFVDYFGVGASVKWHAKKPHGPIAGAAFE